MDKRAVPERRRSRRVEKGEPALPSVPSASAADIYRDLYDEAPVAYVSTNEHGIIQTLNNRAVDLLGIQRHRAVGLPLRNFVAKTDRGDFAAHLARFRAHGRVASELVFRTFNGKESAVRLETQTSFEGPRICRTALFDISAQRHAEVAHARTEEAEKAARAANTVKDRFIAVLSHELRAPLAPVLAAIPHLEEGTLNSPEKLARLAQMIKRNVLREARLIDDLLDVSRITSGKVALRREVTDLHTIVRESVEMLAPRQSRGVRP